MPPWSGPGTSGAPTPSSGWNTSAPSRSAFATARSEGAADDIELGMGVRVVIDGAIGFAATVATGSSQAAALVDEAVEVARTVARAGG